MLCSISGNQTSHPIMVTYGDIMSEFNQWVMKNIWCLPYLRWNRLRNKQYLHNLHSSYFPSPVCYNWHSQWVWKCKSATLSGFIPVRYLFWQSERRMVMRSRMLIDSNGSGLAPLSVTEYLKITHKWHFQKEMQMHVETQQLFSLSISILLFSIL